MAENFPRLVFELKNWSERKLKIELKKPTASAYFNCVVISLKNIFRILTWTCIVNTLGDSGFFRL